MTFDGRVTPGTAPAAVVGVAVPPRRAVVGAACAAVLGSLWVVTLQTVLRQTSWPPGPAPTLATSGQRLLFAAPVVALAAVVSWALVRRPLHGVAAWALFLAAAGAQLVAVLLVRSRPGMDMLSQPVPSVGWFLVVMVGGASGAGLVGVVLGGFQSSSAAGVIVGGEGWAYLAIVGAGGYKSICADSKWLILPQPVLAAAAAGIALVAIGAVLTWRRAGSDHRAVWRGTAVAAVTAAIVFVLALLRQPALIGSCVVTIS